MTDDELLAAFPGIRIDQDNAAHYRGLLEERLLLNRCEDCGVWHHPPRPRCPSCWSAAVGPRDVRGLGQVALITILHQGPGHPGVDYVRGHPLVAVELDEQSGLRVTGTVVGTPPHEIGIGDRVQMVWRQVEGRLPRPDFEVIR